MQLQLVQQCDLGITSSVVERHRQLQIVRQWRGDAANWPTSWKMEQIVHYDVSPPAYDDETALGGATASPQHVSFSFSDRKEKVVSRPNMATMIMRRYSVGWRQALRANPPPMSRSPTVNHTEVNCAKFLNSDRFCSRNMQTMSANCFSFWWALSP